MPSINAFRFAFTSAREAQGRNGIRSNYHLGGMGAGKGDALGKRISGGFQRVMNVEVGKVDFKR
jgi:hypothetical protein